MSKISKYKFDLLIPVIVVLLVSVFFDYQTPAVESQSQKIYPKLANYFLKTPISDAEAIELAKWDLVILGMQAQDCCSSQIKKIRELNPDVKILAYVASQEFPTDRYQTLESANGPWHKLYAGIDSSWWLNRPDGSHFSSWPGNWSLNVTNQAPLVNGLRWNTYLPQLLHDSVMSTGLWDGIFYDNVWGSISWVGDGSMDINRDGLKDDPVWLNAEWQAGMRTMLQKSRQLEGSGKIILGNVNGGSEYKDYLNGRLIENAYQETAWSSWASDQKNYHDFMVAGADPKFSVINNNTDNTGEQNNYQLMRYGLVSALLDNGYYSFDYGTQDHSQLWWYDEYDVNLGQPTAAAYNLSVSSQVGIQAGLWRRDFQNGAVFVNSLPSPQMLMLPDNEEMEKISGGQDPAQNDGSLVNYIRLAAHDGEVLLKPLSEVLDSVFTNGYFARIFDQNGQRLRGGFYTYQKKFSGSKQIIVTDIDRDGDLETIIALDSQIEIYGSNAAKEVTFYPYTEKYNKGINLAVGDVNGDGKLEIVTGAGRGGGPQIRIFSAVGTLINPGFFAYDQKFRGGVNLAVGDINGDGRAEIIAGAGWSGGPQIRIFNQDGRLLTGGWFAYDKNFRGGVNVAAGDINGDGRAEIISAPGFGGQPQVKVWDQAGKLLGQPWLAFDPANRDGVKVLTADVNRDGKLEILAESLNVF